jgi:alkanesulfonate monooxygenase SsuD/methylene tetrahydromethanopterin reductase-like flavin-dependent oxidoreductase (luciferase family)
MGATVKFAIDVPNFGDYSDARALAELARETEDAGWDGFFVWDHVVFDGNGRTPVADPWVALAAIAAATDRIRLGPMVTPLSRRRPWQVARQAVTLDHLSGGRLTLGVGLGHPPDADFQAFGEVSDDRARARRLDEALEVLAGLWTGEPFSYGSEHFRVSDVTFLPGPVQSPRIPIWVAGVWPGKAPFRRAARWDGTFPIKIGGGGFPEALSPEDVRAVHSYVACRREDAAPFDVVIGGVTPGDDPAKATDIVASRAEAGATWWMEEIINPWRGPLDELRERVRRGPPRA